jgi:hypothetical protein
VLAFTTLRSSSPLHLQAVAAGAFEIWIFGNQHVAALFTDEPFRSPQHRPALIAQHAIGTTYDLLSHLEGSFLAPCLTRWSSQTQTCERCASLAATLVRQNSQFKHGHVGEVHGVILCLPYCPRRAEIPLLANNFLEGAPVIRRPSQDELLCALDFAFLRKLARYV